MFGIGTFPAGSYFVLSLFDRLWKPDLTEEEAFDLMKKGEQCAVEDGCALDYKLNSLLLSFYWS